jgi:UDP-N-acetylmuramoylalanine--D-glutamate ligase
LAQRKGSAVTLFDEADTSKLSRSIDAAAQAGIKLVHGATASDAVIQPGDFDLCILSPGFDLAWPLPAKFAAAGIPLTGELEFAAQRCSFPMVAITGTNGKSTTTEILAEIFNHCGKRSLPCGNHGTALSEVLLSDQAYDVLSLEVSSFQLETIDTFHPHISMWLNFAADHLDRYPDEKTYFEAKRRIFGNQTSADYAIVNIQELRRLGDLAPQVISFTSQPEHCAQATYCFRDGKFYHQGEVIGSSEHLRLRGRHNMENVLAALIAHWADQQLQISASRPAALPRRPA